MTEAVQSVPVHPAIAGLLYALPHPEQHWPVIEQEKFLVALRRIFEMVYTYPAPPEEPVGCTPGDVPTANAAGAQS